ncbi:MAG: DUF2807 domain-containing protein [Pricia sp.]
MKKIVFPLILLICFQAYSQRKPKIKGNRDVIEVQEGLPAFSAIELKDDLKVMLQQASEEGYTIEADDNLIDVLKFEVEDSTLVISSFYNITGKKKLDITVSYNYLDAVTVRNGDIQMKDAIVSDLLSVRTYESAKLQLNAEAAKIDVVMEGKSSGDFVLTGDEINLDLKDRADARVFADGKSGHLKMYKSAAARIEGSVDSLRVELFENSSLRGQKLQADEVVFTLEGSSSASVNAINNFELSSSGSAKAYLYGDAKIEIIDFLDTSELHKEK